MPERHGTADAEAGWPSNRPDAGLCDSQGGAVVPAAPASPACAERSLQNAMDRLLALHEGWAGVSDVILCGPRAIPPLREVLFAREPSGVFEPRCRAVAALAGLGADDVLIDYLSGSHAEPDPVARAGDEAVASAAARALGEAGDMRALPLLIRLAKRQPLIGAMEALGRFNAPEAIPALIRGLYEDDSRAAAETALRRLGEPARAALLTLAETTSDPETTTIVRARRSAVRLLADIGIAPRHLAAVRKLIWDEDPEIGVHACAACLAAAAPEQGREIIERLVELLPRLKGAARIVGRRRLAEYGRLAPDLAAREAEIRRTESGPAASKDRRPPLRLPWWPGRIRH